MDVVTPSERVLAIDVFRGLLMVGLAGLIFTPWTGWRGHVAWWGLRPSDAFFPAFLLIAGAGLALQTQRRYPWPRLIRRFVSLVVIGLLVNVVLGAGLDLASLRFAGVSRAGVSASRRLPTYAAPSCSRRRATAGP